MTQVDLSFVREAVERIGRKSDAAIPLLQAIQGHYRYLPDEALKLLCELTEITPAAVEGVATFYPQFRRRPVGRHLIRLCCGTACHVKGAELVRSALFRNLRIPPGEDTTPDGVFTVEKVACLGCCTLAPVVQIDGVTYGHLTPEAVPRMIAEFIGLRDGSRDARPSEAVVRDVAGNLAEVRVGLGSCCLAGGSGDVCDALEQAVAKAHAPAVVKRVGCVGMCHRTPLVEVLLPGRQPVFYARVQPQDAPDIIARHFPPRGAFRRVAAKVSGAIEKLLTDEAWPSVERYAVEKRDPQVAAFLSPQQHVATEYRGQIDPIDLDEYVSHGGFDALRRVVDGMAPAEVIAEIVASGLRGRGGAGYPTGAKWRQVRDAPGDKKYVVCNGDEGDPGAFMDRMILESYPCRVIEGMAIAALAVGADAGVLYIRAEYPLAVTRVREALRRCRDANLLGDNILGSDFSLHLRVMEGAGAFVCGEETALLASIEGRRGMPRFRPPYPATSGLWGRPTLVNNVETCASVPWIIRNGPERYARMGTPRSRGTKVFSLAGKINRGGLIEVPMGITLRTIVEEIGGGIASGRKFKAVQVGGPSGGCVPAELADTPVDYEALGEVGAIMGSGGLVVLDDGDCMVDIARYFLDFTQDQSCGKCTFCRLGTRRMLDVLERLCAGMGKKGDLEELERLARLIQKASLCGLGKTAPNPVLTTLKYFRDEYEAHVGGRCPAGTCRAMINYSITDECIGCTRCAQHCPAEAIEMRPYERHEIDREKCVRCGTCMQVCPVGAVKIES